MTDDLMKRLRSDAHMTQADGLGAMLGTAAEAADKIEALTAENERMREALAHYAQWGVVCPQTDDAIRDDGGDLARAALAGKAEQ
jgi:hypothetical protein